MELERMKHRWFDNYFYGENGNKCVTCILDDYSVRFISFVNGKLSKKKEFTNFQKELCFEEAKKELNKQRKKLNGKTKG